MRLPNGPPSQAEIPYPHGVNADLAIVIVTYNSESVVTRLLDSLPAALGGLSAHVVVVDNGSHDRTAAVVAARNDCQLVQSTNTGYAGGINVGVRAAADVGAVLVLNADVVLGEDCVAPLLARLAQPNIGVVVPRVLNPDGSTHQSLRREPTFLRAVGLGRTRVSVLSEYVTNPAAYEYPSAVDWALGAAMMISRACFDSLGGWDSSYFLYSEETDFCLRAEDSGWLTWYEPASRVMHVGGDSGRDDETHVMQIINRVRLYSRRHRAAGAFAYYCMTVLSELSWIARGHRQSRAAVRALLKPSARPESLKCSQSVLPC
jgi:N-acetylglucosaminyl-diphospho-decaprenol L-rhamnosyltransferase